jgi:hypothetical protein
MKVYNVQNHWVYGFFLIVWNSKQIEKRSFRKLVLFPSSGKGKKTPNLLGPLRRA